MNTATPNPQSKAAGRAETVVPLEIGKAAPPETPPVRSAELARLTDEIARQEATEQHRRREAEIARQAREAQRPPLGLD